MAARVSKHWEYNPRLDIKEFDPNNITADNLINMILLVTQKDIIIPIREIVDMQGEIFRNLELEY